MLDDGIATTLKVDDNLIIQFVANISLKVNKNSLDNQRKMTPSQELGVTEELKGNCQPSSLKWSFNRKTLPTSAFTDFSSTLLDVFVKALLIHSSIYFPL